MKKIIVWLMAFCMVASSLYGMEDKDKELRAAINAKNANEVASLLKKYTEHVITLNLNKVYASGNTPLCYAIEKHSLEIVTALIDAGADINFPDKNGATPLINAVKNKQTKIIQQLIEKKADLNSKITTGRDYFLAKGSTALIASIKSDTINISNMLVDAGADINTTDEHGWSALMYAAREGYNGFLKKLISKECNLNAKTTTSIDFGTPEGSTALMIALSKKNKECATELIDAGAELETTDGNGWNALMWVAYAFKEDSALLQMLISKKVDLDKQTTSNKYLIGKGCTALMIAIKEKNKEAAIMLINAGANLELTDEYGWNALMYSVHEKMLDILQTLIDKKVDFNKQTTQYAHLVPAKTTALALAIESNNINITQALINAGATIRSEEFALLIVDSVKDSALLGIIQEVIAKNQAIASQEMLIGNDYVTPLMLAVIVGQIDIVQLLIKHKVNLTTQLKNDTPMGGDTLPKGTTALGIAQKIKESLKILSQEHSDKLNKEKKVNEEIIKALQKALETSKSPVNISDNNDLLLKLNTLKKSLSYLQQKLSK